MKKLFIVVALASFSLVNANNSISKSKETKNASIKFSPECDAAGREAFNVVVEITGNFDRAKEARIRVTKACEDKQKQQAQLTQNLN